MKVKLIADARVNLPAGTEIEVSEAEAKRLAAFGLVAPAKAEKKRSAKK